MVCTSIAQVVPAGPGEARCDFLPLLFQELALAGRMTMEKAHFIGPLSRKKARRSSGLKLLILSLSKCEMGIVFFLNKLNQYVSKANQEVYLPGDCRRGTHGAPKESLWHSSKD